MTSLSIHAYSILMELGAKLSHEVAWEMSLLLKLVHTVSIWACVSKFTMSKHFKISAKFSFLLAFILLSELKAFFSILEIFLFPASSCFTTHVFVLHFAVHEDEITSVFIDFTLVNIFTSIWVISITIRRWGGTICWSIRLWFHLIIFIIFHLIGVQIRKIHISILLCGGMVEISLILNLRISVITHSSLSQYRLIWGKNSTLF